MTSTNSLWFCLRILDLRAALLAGAVLYLVALLGGPGDLHRILFPHFNLRNGPFTSTLFVALGIWLAKRGFKCSSREAVIVLCAGLLLHASEVCFLYYHYGQPIRNHDFICGTVPFSLGAMLWALSLPDYSGPFRLAHLGTYSLGIYAIHPYVIQLLQGWFAEQGVVVSAGGIRNPCSAQLHLFRALHLQNQVGETCGGLIIGYCSNLFGDRVAVQPLNQWEYKEWVDRVESVISYGRCFRLARQKIWRPENNRANLA